MGCLALLVTYALIAAPLLNAQLPNLPFNGQPPPPGPGQDGPSFDPSLQGQGPNGQGLNGQGPPPPPQGPQPGLNGPQGPQGPQQGNFIPPRQLSRNSQCRISTPGCGLRTNNRQFVFDDALRYAKRGDVPWQLTIKVQSQNTKWFCSATAISNEWAVCQAWCLFNKRPGDLGAELFKVILGELNPYASNHTKSNSLDVAEIKFHPTADLALIRVARPMPRSVNPICLPANNRADHGIGKVSGWPQYILNYLSTASAISFPYDHCTGLGNDEKTLLCVVSQGPPDCGMDTGSPFYRQTSPNAPMLLVGIKLQDEKCRVSDNDLSTERYLRISSFTQWIGEAMGICSRGAKLLDDEQENETF